MKTMSSQRRRGFIPGGSEQFNRYRALRRHQQRVILLNRRGASGRNEDQESSSNSDHSLEADPDHEIQKVVNYVRTFNNDLYLALREKHPQALVYSPLGFCISSVLIKLGCVQVGEEELSRALFSKVSGEGDASGEREDSSELVVGLSALMDSVKEESGSFMLKHTHKIFMDYNHKPRKTYRKLVQTIMSDIDLEEVDFSNLEWEESSAIINRWAHEAGGKKLGEILTRRGETRPKMIFVNPVYFMGNWVHPFNPGLTQEQKFFLNEKQAVNVPMMKSGLLKNLLYSPLNKLGCRAIVLPYKGDRLGLVIFLPNEKGAVTLLESSLEQISPAQYLHEMQSFRRKLSTRSGIRVCLPRLTIDCTIDLKSPMKEFGIETVFTPGKADFSGMAHISAKDLSITEIIQKVVFEINEIGTDSVPEKFKTSTNNQDVDADAEVDAKISEDGYSEVIEFRVDHPFYFQLIDMKTDLILLAGSCRNPIEGQKLGFKEFLEKYDIEVSPSPSQPKQAAHVNTCETSREK